MIVYRCEDSAESIFTAVYQAYDEKRNHRDTMLCLTDDPILFGEDVEVKADREKAGWGGGQPAFGDGAGFRR